MNRSPAHVAAIRPDDALKRARSSSVRGGGFCSSGGCGVVRPPGMRRGRAAMAPSSSCPRVRVRTSAAPAQGRCREGKHVRTHGHEDPLPRQNKTLERRRARSHRRHGHRALEPAAGLLDGTPAAGGPWQHRSAVTQLEIVAADAEQQPRKPVPGAGSNPVRRRPIRPRANAVFTK